MRKSCPTCRCTVLTDGEFAGTGTFKIYCPHCYKIGIKTLVEVSINPKTTMTLTKIALILIVILIGFTVLGRLAKNATTVLTPPGYQDQ